MKRPSKAVLGSLQLGLRLVLGLLLLVGGWSKLVAFDWWRDLVEQMDLFNATLTGPLAAILPGIEMVAGMALIAGFLSHSAALLALALHLLFTTIMTILWLQDAPQSCGCFGPGSEYPVDLLHLLGNALQLLAAFMLYRLPLHKLSLDRLRRQIPN